MFGDYAAAEFFSLRHVHIAFLWFVFKITAPVVFLVQGATYAVFYHGDTATKVHMAPSRIFFVTQRGVDLEGYLYPYAYRSIDCYAWTCLSWTLFSLHLFSFSDLRYEGILVILLQTFFFRYAMNRWD